MAAQAQTRMGWQGKDSDWVLVARSCHHLSTCWELGFSPSTLQSYRARSEHAPEDPEELRLKGSTQGSALGIVDALRF